MSRCPIHRSLAASTSPPFFLLESASAAGKRVESRSMAIKGRVAITGRPGVGKTTLIESVLSVVPATVGGFLTKEIRKCGHRIGFALVDLGTGEECLFARAGASGGARVGRYAVDVGAIERVGVPAILHAIETKDLVVIDEIAPMELRAPGFVAAVEKALASDRALLIATHAHATHPIADRARQELRLVRVRLGNRDALVDTVAALLRGEAPPNPTSRVAPQAKPEATPVPPSSP